ncbi:MAG TPA: response regulator, partial [Polyangiaceae bacterium]|nr:response regulator [Polyangiaceae bacterium]
DVLKRIFEPFYTTKELGKGTGLGLAAVYGTVQNHKGAIDISSELGKGTEARLYLRVAEGVKEKPQVEPDSSALLTRAHVVVVDDEPLICEVACQLLTLLGCTVTPFLSGKEALDYYTRAHDKVDLVLLDMGMPVMDGKETYLAMRRINPGIKALICSGYALDGDARSLLNEGVNGFIQKPYRAQTLAKQLQQILNLES